LDSEIVVEVLTPDFNGKESSLAMVLEAEPDIFNHNVETVERLTPFVRSRAKYRLSLKVLGRAKELDPAVVTKSGVMVGLGETESELFRTLDDLRAANVQVLTLGQYLRPTPDHLPVLEYIRPETFEAYKEVAERKGFDYVASGPLVRSSYHAADYHPARRRSR
jgi:lipoic acid synthetase